MPKLLVIEASPRGEYSISRNLASKFIADWKKSHPEGEVVERDLAKMEPAIRQPALAGRKLDAYRKTHSRHAGSAAPLK